MRKVNTPKLTVSKLVNRNIENYLSNKKNKELFTKRLYSLKSQEADYKGVLSLWTTRNYYDYNDVFREVVTFGRDKTKNLPGSITELLEERYKSAKKPLRVLDDGAGQGQFLAELKSKLQERKIPIETTAISLSDNIKRGNKKNINQKIFKDAKDIEFTKKYDLITSYFGSIHYSIPKIRDEIMKRYIFSLNKNGIALFRFTEFHKEQGKKSLNWLNLLEKVGFSVICISEEKLASSTDYTLLIQRLR